MSEDCYCGWSSDHKYTVQLTARQIDLLVDAAEIAEANQRYEEVHSDVKTDLPDEFAEARVALMDSAESDNWEYRK